MSRAPLHRVEWKQWRHSDNLDAWTDYEFLQMEPRDDPGDALFFPTLTSKHSMATGLIIQLPEFKSRYRRFKS